MATLYLVSDPSLPAPDWSLVETHDYGYLDELGARFGEAHRVNSWLAMKRHETRILALTAGARLPDAVARVREYAASRGIETALSTSYLQAKRLADPGHPDRWSELRSAEPTVEPGAAFDGAELRRQRVAIGLTQAQTATALGYSVTAIAGWERGELTMEHPRVIALAMEALRMRSQEARP